MLIWLEHIEIHALAHSITHIEAKQSDCIATSEWLIKTIFFSLLVKLSSIWWRLLCFESSSRFYRTRPFDRRFQLWLSNVEHQATIVIIKTNNNVKKLSVSLHGEICRFNVFMHIFRGWFKWYWNNEGSFSGFFF